MSSFHSAFSSETDKSFTGYIPTIFINTMDTTLITSLSTCVLLLATVKVKADPSRVLGAPSTLSVRTPSGRLFPSPQQSRINCEPIVSPRSDSHRNRGRVIAATTDNEEGAPWLPRDSNCNEIYASDQESYEEPKKVAHWRVEDKNLVRVISSEYSALKSDHTYIVVKHEGSGKVEYKSSTRIQPQTYLHTVYYWIGSSSSEADAMTAAYFAMIQTSCLRDELKIRRETEGFESKAFKMLFRENEDNDDEEAPTDVDMNKKRMFMINGGDTLDLEEVELKLIYTLATGSCFVFVSQKVHIACGKEATEPQKRAVKELAKIMMKKKGLEIEEAHIHPSRLVGRWFYFSVPFPEGVNSLFADLTPEDEDDLHNFFAEFERPSKADDKRPVVFTPEEMRRVLGQTRWLGGEEYFNVEIIRIFTDEIGYICEEPYLSYNQFRVVELNSKDCYLIDSHSNVGLFIWLGEESSMFVRTQSSERAESYLKEKGYHLATPVTFVDEEDLPADIWLRDLVVLLKPENNQDDVPRPPMH